MKPETMQQDVKHFLISGFITACGIQRHFGCGVQPEIATIRHDVTCNICRNSEEFIKYSTHVDNEIEALIHLLP